MTIDQTAALRAYANAASLTGQTDISKTNAGALKNPGDFGELVTSAINGVRETGQKAEALTANLANGKADVVDLVTAVAETEVAVQSLVTVRDRVITAYQEILNMPI